MKNSHKNTRLAVTSALLAAIIFVCTRFTAIPIFGGQGYVHIGDAFVFLSAAMLPTPYAMASSAIGAGLADLTAGYTMYVFPTAIIKSLMALMFLGSCKSEKLFTVKNVISLILGIIVLVGGYYITEVILSGSFISPLLGMIWNAAQGIFSAAAFIFLALAFDRAKLRDRLSL